MPLYTHNKFPLSGLKKLSVAVSLALVLPVVAHAANFGKLTVLSSLGQPLRAEIELTSVTKEEEGKLVARLANGEAFRKANIDVNPVLSSLRFSVEQRQGRQFIRIVSGQPINEPFVDMLLELYSASSRQLREYTFLLDPPDTRKPQTAQATPAPLLPPPAVARTPAAAEAKPAAAKPAAAPVTPATPTITPAVVAAAAPAPVEAPAAMTPAAPAVAAPAEPVMGTLADEEPVPKIVSKEEPSKLAEDLIRDGRSEQSAATNAPVPDAVAEKLAAPEAAAKTAEAPATVKGRRTRAAPAPAKADAEGGKSYRVKDGDTLAQIANRNKETAVSLDQMLVALYRANPDAFMGDNINRLRAGRVLSLPDTAAAETIDKGEAHSTVVAQAQDFNAYRNKLAGQVASGAARKASESKQSGSGKVTARVEEKSSAGEAKDKLQLSKAGAGTADKAAAEKAAAEDKIAADKAIAEANERVKELEKNVSDLQKLLEIKNKTLAEMSEQQKAAATAPAPAAPASVAPPAAPAAAEVAKAEPAPPAAAAAPESKPAEAPKAAPPMTPVPAKIAKPGFFDHIQDNPFALPAGGLLVALLAGLGFMRLRNQQKPAAKTDKPVKKAKPAKEAEPAAEVAEPTIPVLEAAPLAAAAAVVAEPVLAPVAEPEPEPVDPIAEANMYITYGRDEQAEDILRLALRTDPNRQAIRLKLLEIYAKRQDVDAFNDTARELHDATDGIGADWDDAVAMGILLDPTNPLYGGSPLEEVVEEIAPVEEVLPEPVAPEPEPEPEEAGLEFDLNDFKAAEVPPGAAAGSDIGSKIDFDLELDNGTPADAEVGADPDIEEAPPTVSTAVPPPPVPIDLDLPEPAEPPPADPLEDEESAFAAEMSTKLDLAAAYQEIGDREGARELLEEVIRGGSDSQIARAKEMLSTLT